jgi:hypothetical protein
MADLAHYLTTLLTASFPYRGSPLEPLPCWWGLDSTQHFLSVVAHLVHNLTPLLTTIKTCSLWASTRLLVSFFVPVAVILIYSIVSLLYLALLSFPTSYWLLDSISSLIINAFFPSAIQFTLKMIEAARSSEMLVSYCKTAVSRSRRTQLVLWKTQISHYQTTACFLYRTWRLITVLTKVRHWILSWASWIQFTPSIHASLRSILMLSSHLHLGLPSGLFPSGIPIEIQNPINTSPLPHVCHRSHPPHSPWFKHPNNIQWRAQAVEFIIM